MHTGKIGYFLGVLVLLVMMALYADFRVKEDRIRQGEALDRGDTD